MGPEFIFLAAMTVVQPNQVDSNILARYVDRETKASENLDRLLKQRVSKEYIEYAGYTGYIVNLAATRTVSFRVEF